jgi:hypothetical protein
MSVQSKIPPTGSVYAKIAAVQGELAKVGIAKSRRNQQGSGYNFRGIDDVYAALSPLLAVHGLVIVPRVTSREVIERSSKSGGALFYVTVHAEFDFVSADDGSIHTAATFGEAMDSGDKATNKAMSAAYKYAAFMTFAIPTEGDNDADAHTQEVAAQLGEEQRQGATVSPPQAKPDDATITKIISLCEAVGGNQSKVICDAYNIKAITDLTANQASAVVTRLTEKLAEKAKAQTNAELADEIPY